MSLLMPATSSVCSQSEVGVCSDNSDIDIVLAREPKYSKSRLFGLRSARRSVTSGPEVSGEAPVREPKLCANGHVENQSVGSRQTSTTKQ